MKCSEIQESLKAGSGGAFRSHLEECPECAKVAARELSLSNLIKMAPGAEPPADFEAELMRKIENRMEAGPGSFWFRPQILIPASAFAVLVMVFIAFLAIAPSGSGPDVVEIAPQATPDESPSNTEVPAEDKDGDLPDPEELAETVDPQPVTSGERNVPLPAAPKVPSGRDKEELGGGSRDLAADPGQRTVPPWVGTPEEAPDPVPSRKFSPKEILGEFGINARFESRGWRVVSVRPGSIGARSGVKRGDIIKALDGKVLDETPLEGGGKQLQVVRSGREITLEIRP